MLSSKWREKLTDKRSRNLIDDGDFQQYEMQNLGDAAGNEPTFNTPPAQISDGVMTTFDDISDLSGKGLVHGKSPRNTSRLLIVAIFSATALCNILLLCFLYQLSCHRESKYLAYILAVSLIYLPLCGLFQSLCYPQSKLSVHELRSLLNDMVTISPKIMMQINGCNLFEINQETGKFNQVLVHSNHHEFICDHIEDRSDDIESLLNSLSNMRNARKCNKGVSQVNISLMVHCGNEETSMQYNRCRDAFISDNIKTKTQEFTSSAVFVENGELLLGNSPIAIGGARQFWIMDNDSWFVNHFTSDAAYWILSILFLSQWLYVLLALVIVSKYQTFTIRKEIYVQSKDDDNLDGDDYKS